MSENKTQPTEVSVDEFIANVMPDRRREDALILNQLFKDVTGWQPQMWGPTMIGYGSYHYIYDSGREGDSVATGFSPRKANLVLYIMPRYQDFGHILDKLGKHKLGKACLYINKLADVDIDVVAEIIRAGVDDLGTRWPITPS
ncbi:protein of unknown function (DU1801) [Cognatiyoonia sediminum]|uniref:YdhG-like domain-containing protein n=1 Tax=Cognatiyoonia sediminum TaxID=1508389 RepID=A0A1M5NWG3_9RHOB|nr:DUF1801 domain-containing protein [Cognatiyoonia sediminum]SHG93837.1 protein of unknown function (DU1801) [Cognatiyoonia sediminum]